MTGPQEASFGDAHDANLAYFDAAHTDGPDSPAAQEAAVAFEITNDAAEQAFDREPPEPEAEAEL